MYLPSKDAWDLGSGDRSVDRSRYVPYLTWLDPPMHLLSLYQSLVLDLFQISYTLLNSLNIRISRGLEQFQSLNLAESAQVTSATKDDWSRAVLHVEYCASTQRN
jgi:hypothetical protein